MQFRQANHQAGGGDRHLKIADSPIRLRFAGSAMMAKLFPALGHLERPPNGTPSLTIHLWDAASTGDMLSPPPWDELPHIERAQIRRYQDDRFFLAYDRNTSVFVGFDRAQAAAFYWTRDAEWIPYYETAAPMRHLLQAWLNSNGVFVCHGAAVGLESGAILLAGRGGMGKSTTSLLSLQDDFSFLGDDFVLLSNTHAPTVHSLYSSAKLNADAVAWLPDVQPLITNREKIGPREKALLFLYPTYQARLIDQLPLRAIVIPQPSDDPTPSLTSMGGAAAFRLLAPDTVFRGQGDAQRTLHLYRELIQQIPIYRLNLGALPAAVPGLLRSLLSPEPA